MQKSNLYSFNSNIQIRFENKPMHIENKDLSIIQDNWKKIKMENDLIFNGSVLSLWNINISSDSISLQFRQTDYAHFLASESELISEESRCRSFYVSAMIETSDNFLTFAEMGELSFSPGRLQFIGGGLDLSYISESTIDIESCIIDEIKEEIGLDCRNSYYVKKIIPKYLCIGKIKNKISVVFHTKLEIDSKELVNILKLHNEKILRKKKTPEVEKIIFVTKVNYRKYFYNMKEEQIDENLYSSVNKYFKES